MLKQDETFFTTVGCMDGRAQEPVVEFGRKKFGATYPDTITEAGLVGKLGKELPEQSLIDSIRQKLLISLEIHRSKGIVVHGHQECAASDAMDDENHKDDIRNSIQVITSLINSCVPVVGVFVKHSQKNPKTWEAEEIPPKILV